MGSYVEMLRSGHLTVPLLRLFLCLSQVVPVGDDVLRHNPVSAFGNRIKQSRCRQRNNITSVLTKNPVVGNMNVNVLAINKLMVRHGLAI